VHSLPRRFRSATTDGLSAEWELQVGTQTFAVQIANHLCQVRDGPATAPVSIIMVDPDIWFAIDEGSLTGPQAYMDRHLLVTGNLDLAVRLQTLFRPFRRPRRPADLDQLEVQVDEEVTLSCYVVGRGRPLVLLHGLGASKISLIPLLGPLAERNRVIAPDLPGHGESSKPVTDYSPRFYARAVRGLMNELEVEQAVLVGNSLGGRVALELALRSPGRVAAMALLDPSVPGFRWRYIAGFTRAFPAEFGAIPFFLRERWMVSVMSRLFADPSVLPPEALSVAAREFIRIYRDPKARVAFLTSLRQIVTERPEPFFGSLRRVKQPTLVLFGAEDRLVPPRLGVRLVQHLPNAELKVLPDVGHVPQFEATDVTIRLLEQFLESLPKPPKAPKTLKAG
jgi:pimeloyl-ACP methyl ester carboxylesterase